MFNKKLSHGAGDVAQAVTRSPGMRARGAGFNPLSLSLSLFKKKVEIGLGVVVHTCNTSSSGG